MLIRVDPRSAEPIFEQIVFQVKGAVARGEAAQGDKLPSVRSLARDLSVNPNTVVRAYEHLERDGLIVRRQGAGCFIDLNSEALDARARSEQLEALMERTVTEAFHLGARPREIRGSLARALDTLKFTRGGKGN